MLKGDYLDMHYASFLAFQTAFVNMATCVFVMQMIGGKAWGSDNNGLALQLNFWCSVIQLPDLMIRTYFPNGKANSCCIRFLSFVSVTLYLVGSCIMPLVAFVLALSMTGQDDFTLVVPFVWNIVAFFNHLWQFSYGI